MALHGLITFIFAVGAGLSNTFSQTPKIRGTFFYGRRKVDLIKTANVNAYIMHIFGKIELLSIHAT